MSTVLDFNKRPKCTDHYCAEEIIGFLIVSPLNRAR